MIIDFHIHPYCKEAGIIPDFDGMASRLFEANLSEEEAARSRAGFEFVFTQRGLKDIVADMDDSGVDKAVIVGMDLTTSHGVEVVTDDDLEKMTKAYPDRFIPFAGVDPRSGRAAIDKLKRAVDMYGCRGIKLHPELQEIDVTDPVYDAFWKACLDLDLIVWSHAAVQKSLPLADTRLAHPMKLEPVAVKFRNLKIVLGHCGFPWHWEAWAMVHRHPNVYLDISVYHPLYNHLPWDAFPKYGCEHKLLFATDYPALGFKETLDALDGVDISEDFRNKIKGENAARLLNL